MLARCRLTRLVEEVEAHKRQRKEWQIREEEKQRMQVRAAPFWHRCGSSSACRYAAACRQRCGAPAAHLLPMGFNRSATRPWLVR
jgi:hypothetical protein